ncbi:MAG: hypothetical protein EOP11_01575 [Proteobacteria bacterium]|nr:MAG: hypothetical protein EOP11_01575 [Pseudomonadota bacterium]
MQQMPPSNDPELVRIQMHALAGASGFESVKFKEQMQAAAARIQAGPSKPPAEIFQLLSKDRAVRPKFNLLTLWNFKLYRSTEQLKEILQDAPELNPEAKIYLNRAIDLYGEQGWKPATSTAEDNFRWGALRAYRASARIAELSRRLDEMAKSNDMCEGQAMQARSIELFILVNSDIFGVLQHFKHSYSRVKKVATDLSKSLEKLSRGNLDSAAIENAETQEALLRQAFFSGYAGISDALALRWMAVGGFSGLLRNCEAENGPEIAALEARFKQDRARATTRVFTRDLLEKKDQAEYYTPVFFSELGEAATQVSDHDDAAPMSSILQRRGTQTERLGQIVRLVANDIPPAQGGEFALISARLTGSVDMEQAAVLNEDMNDLKILAGEVGAVVDDTETKYAAYATNRLKDRGRTAP